MIDIRGRNPGRESWYGHSTFPYTFDMEKTRVRPTQHPHPRDANGQFRRIGECGDQREIAA